MDADLSRAPGYSQTKSTSDDIIIWELQPFFTFKSLFWTEIILWWLCMQTGRYLRVSISKYSSTHRFTSLLIYASRNEHENPLQVKIVFLVSAKIKISTKIQFRTVVIRNKTHTMQNHVNNTEFESFELPHFERSKRISSKYHILNMYHDEWNACSEKCMMKLKMVKMKKKIKEEKKTKNQVFSDEMCNRLNRNWI